MRSTGMMRIEAAGAVEIAADTMSYQGMSVS